VYVLSKKKGPAYAVFYELPAAVLLSDDRCDRHVALPQGVEMVMPGDNVSVDVTVIAPVAMERGQRFAIREGGRTIGAGRVTDVIT